MATYNLVNNKTQNINLTGLTSAQLASALASLSAFESAVESGTRSTLSTLTVGSDTYKIAKGKTNAKVDFTYDGIKFADYASLTAYIAAEATEASVLTTAEAVAAALASDKTTLTTANTTLASEKAALTAANAALTTSNAALTTSNNTLQGYLAGFGDANADGLLDAQTINLTVGIDERTGSNFNDTFNAYAVNVDPTAAPALFSATLTPMDRINGGLGQDTLNVVDVNAINTTLVTGLQLTSIEAVSLRSNAAITANTIPWTGTTSLTTDNSAGIAAAQILTAGLSTTVSALGSGALTINGGSAVTGTTLTGDITVGNTIAPSGAIILNNLVQANSTISINGGTNVTLNSTNNVSGAITVGNTTAPSGAIVVNTSIVAAAAIGVINVTGGTSVAVNQSAFNAVTTTSTAGAVTVTGGAATTSVTVTDNAAATAGAAVAGHINGAVTINDVNRADLLLPGTIAGVTLTNYGASTIDSSAIATVNLSGTGGSLDISRGDLTAVPTANTLALNVNALSGANSITDAEAVANSGFTTINLANTGTSVIANLTAADLTTLNISGSGSLSLVANTLGGATTTAITSTSTGLVTLGAALNAATAYTGGSGADTITVGATAKAIATNGGDDTVTLTSATLAAGGSIKAGAAGSDTLQTTALIAATASATAPLGAVFTAAVSGFEKLVLTGGGTNTVDVSRIGAFSDISTAGDTLLTLDGVTSGSTLRLTAIGTAQTINTTTALTAGTADSLNAVLTGVTTLGNVAFGSLTATNIENINVNSGYDSSMTAANITAATTASFANQLTILGNNAQSIVVSGAAGLNLTAASTALTLVDASSNTVGSAGEFSWTSGATTGAVTVRGLVSGINTVDLSNATVAGTYTGSADADTVTIANALANVLTLGNGTNLVNGAALGNNTVTGGSGSDTFITATVGNNIINFGDGTNAFTATTGNNTYTGGAGNDTVNVTTGNNTLTLGNGTNIFNAQTGNNNVTGGSGADTVVTSTGNNIVSLGNGANSFTATAGANTYTGGTDIDTIVTGAGADIIIGGGGADLITAGAGADRITVSGATATITQAVGASGTNTSTTIQTAELTSTFDVIFGAAAGLTINLGNNTIVTAGLTLAGANLAAGAADTAVFARGTYDAANGIFSYGAAGLDTAITYDSSAAVGVTAETIILVGYASAATTVAALGVLTLA